MIKVVLKSQLILFFYLFFSSLVFSQYFTWKDFFEENISDLKDFHFKTEPVLSEDKKFEFENILKTHPDKNDPTKIAKYMENVEWIKYGIKLQEVLLQLQSGLKKIKVVQYLYISQKKAFNPLKDV